MTLIKGTDGKIYSAIGEIVVADLQAQITALTAQKSVEVQRTSDRFDAQIAEIQNTINQANSL
jgi:glycosyltransferase A (GT-A) superfamily protein (DUF2064 family)